MPFGIDFETGAAQALSAANCIARVGGADATVSNNSTVTALAAAIQALPVTAGFAQDDLDRIARGLKAGVLAGALAETHTYTTIAGMTAGIQAYIPQYATTFDGFLPQ